MIVFLAFLPLFTSVVVWNLDIILRPVRCLQAVITDHVVLSAWLQSWSAWVTFSDFLLSGCNTLKRCFPSMLLTRCGLPRAHSVGPRLSRAVLYIVAVCTHPTNAAWASAICTYLLCDAWRQDAASHCNILEIIAVCSSTYMLNKSFENERNHHIFVQKLF